MVFQTCLGQVQIEEWRVGVEIDFYYKGKQRFPAVRAYTSFIFNSSFDEGLILNYGPTLSVYNNTIGSLSTPLKFDLQMDLVNSFTIGVGGGGEDHLKYMRTLNNNSTYNLLHNWENMAAVSVNLILNNNGRHQYNGALTATFGDFTFTYYNDGGPFFEHLGLGDQLDRFWTGGLSLFFHNYEAYNDVELSFDQFTGFSPLMYKFSTLLGIDFFDYPVSNSKIGNPKLNTSEYNARVFLNRNYSLDLGVRGSLTSYGANSGKTYYYGLQDLLHVLLGFSLHPNTDTNKWKLGMSSNFSQYYEEN